MQKEDKGEAGNFHEKKGGLQDNMVHVVCSLSEN